ncbi:MAG: spermidine synthase [Paracoccaceae bacterium]
MRPWIDLASAVTPDGTTLRLFRRDTEYSIRLPSGNELMNSRLGGSEEALATQALSLLPGRPAARILIGGLGMGFTLRATQAIAGTDASLVVSEIVPEVVAWATTYMGDVFGDCLSDPRVVVRTTDVAELIRNAAAQYDAILLDVDNGPDGLTRPDNQSLYSEAGLAAARQALTPGGVLAIWSAAPDDAFTRRLSRCGFEAEAVGVWAGHRRRGARHTIWLARRP